ncbi:MAG TPA: hypothetical protein VFJ97_00980 [Dermatophilaceae bacterium]|nr:hypothetical protein [Dermatophilaceae bacterium]
MQKQVSGWRRYTMGASLVAAGLVAGAVAAGSISANAASGTASTTTYSAASSSANQTAPDRTVDESKSQRPDEKLLTGTNATKARAAALAKYPGATIQRVETDSDGVYEAHIVTASGQRLIVQMDASFTVTGTDSGHR